MMRYGPHPRLPVTISISVPARRCTRSAGTRNRVSDFSVQPLCSLCLCGCRNSRYINHRDTENTEVAQRRAKSCFAVIFLPVIALVVVVIVRLKIDVVQYDAEYLRSHIAQQLLRSPNDVSRALAAMDHEQHAVNHRSEERRVGKEGRS